MSFLTILLQLIIIVRRFQIVLTNRLVLNLYEWANTRESSEFRTRTGFEPPMFATNSVMGSIGAPMRTLLLCSYDYELNVPEEAPSTHRRGRVEPA